MLRKIVKQGNSALTLTLPSLWTKKFNLKAGDEVEVNEDKNTLNITTQKLGEKEITLNIKSLPEVLVWTYIIAAYRKGYSLIKINYDKAQLKTIQKASDALLGLVITQQSNETCIIKDMSSFPTESEFESIKRRIFYLLEEISESTLNALIKKDKEELKNIELQDYNINKFSNFSLRIINQKKLSGSLEYIISELENLGDEYTRMALELSGQQSLQCKKELIELFKKTNEFLISFHKMVYSFDNEKLKTIVEEKNSLNRKISSIKPENKTETIVLFHLSKIIHIIINIGERVVIEKLE
ncbi:MAG: AbrB/MazE/SpoVT family DNA-binding domain-containing protein [Candidatus Nanoarchaeia archaeon]